MPGTSPGMTERGNQRLNSCRRTSFIGWLSCCGAGSLWEGAGAGCGAACAGAGTGSWAPGEGMLRPWLWLLSHTTDYRIFENKKAPDIIEEVFRDRGFTDFESEIKERGSFPTLEYYVQYRETDLAMFANMAGVERFQSPEAVPFTILLPAYVTSELKTAFQIGFLIFLPFLIIDLIVSSTLMSLGMMMLSPTIVSMPFKLLLFVMVDGWALTMGSLAASFASG